MWRAAAEVPLVVEVRGAAGGLSAKTGRAAGGVLGELEMGREAGETPAVLGLRGPAGEVPAEVGRAA